MKRIQADSQMRAGDVSDKRRGRPQVVANRTIGLKLQRRAHAMLLNLLRDLHQGNLYPLNRLLRQRPRHIACDDDRTNLQLTAEVQSAAEKLPSFPPRLALAGQQAALQAGDIQRQPRFFEPIAHVLERMAPQVHFELRQPDFGALASRASKILQVPIERRVETGNLADRGHHRRRAASLSPCRPTSCRRMPSSFSRPLLPALSSVVLSVPRSECPRSQRRAFWSPHQAALAPPQFPWRTCPGSSRSAAVASLSRCRRKRLAIDPWPSCLLLPACFSVDCL